LLAAYRARRRRERSVDVMASSPIRGRPMPPPGFVAYLQRNGSRRKLVSPHAV
jgi:hypothetical protein